MIEGISYSYKGRSIDVEQLCQTKLKQSESLRYHRLLGYRVITKIDPSKLSWTQTIEYKIGSCFFSLIYGRNSAEAANKAWQKLEEETAVFSSNDTKIRLIRSKQRDYCLPNEVKLREREKLESLQKSLLDTKKNLNKTHLANQESDRGDKIKAFVKQNQQEELEESSKSKIDELQKSENLKTSSDSLKTNGNVLNIEKLKKIENQLRLFDEYNATKQNLEQANKALEKSGKEQKEESIEPPLVKESKIDEKNFSDQQNQAIKESALIKQETIFYHSSFPKDVLKLIFQYLPDADAFGSCIKVCKLFKKCLEGLRDRKNKELLKPWLKGASGLSGFFNKLGIIKDITFMSAGKQREIYHFHVSRNPPKNWLLELELNDKRPMPPQQTKMIELAIEETNKEEEEKKKLATPADEIYEALNTAPLFRDCTIGGCFDETGHFRNLEVIVPAPKVPKLKQFELRRDQLGMWKLSSKLTINSEQKEILESTVKKFNEEIRKQFEFAQDKLYSLFRSSNEIWGRFNSKKGFLEILDTTTNQENNFQFHIIKNELDVWEVVSKNEQAPLTPSQDIILEFIRRKFNHEEVFEKEIGVWKKIMLKPYMRFTPREKQFYKEFGETREIIRQLNLINS